METQPGFGYHFPKYRALVFGPPGSVPHEQGKVGVSQHVAGDAAKECFDQRTVRVGTHDQQVDVEFASLIEELLAEYLGTKREYVQFRLDAVIGEDPREVRLQGALAKANEHM